ncbi:MAG: response regulator [Gammaproteobacteria bacterium]|nr:response regulator [Gammaproteobacteria bacterium]MDH3428813.1 response regulator [Gammaproteobacteria bacterium]MDH3432255.1 response regulator [Gammaproteobacteria bacterium]
MTEKVLFVDDEPNVLQSIRRGLRKQFDVHVAEGGEAALQLLHGEHNFAVIVSDMRMPGMNGVELLSRVKQLWPDTVRMMLTGNADQETAVDAVNHGDIFRFLNKPCENTALSEAVKEGIRRHMLIVAERDLLENTLRGSIKALAEILSLTNPEVFGRTTRHKHLMHRLATAMKLADIWQLESIALLSQLGCVTVAEELVKRKAGGFHLSAEDLQEFVAHAKVGADLLAAIPRMDVIAESVRYQERNFDGTGHPADGPSGEDIPLGARLMRVILDFDAFESSGASSADALHRLRKQQQCYDPAILAALESLLGDAATAAPVLTTIGSLTDVMILADDVRTSTDVLLVAKGQEATSSVRRHLQNFLIQGLISNEVLVIHGK